MVTLSQMKDQVMLHGEYSTPIVILSIAIACIASYTALSLNERINRHSFFHRNVWLGLASFAMGLGIWSMHFIGMSAFMLPIPMNYDIFTTIISILPALVASYLAFYIANRTNRTHWPYALAGIVMGLGISAMHYIGMAAMRMEAVVYYKSGIVWLSVGIAIVVSYCALYIFSFLQKYMEKHWLKILTSITMGFAIASMHYTGMAAIVFYADHSFSNNEMQNMNFMFLIAAVTIGMFLVLGLSGLSGLLDRYVEYRLNYFDALTLLPNRRQFEKDMREYGQTGSLAIVHLQDLEKWNSRYGYSFGDKIIQNVSKILLQLAPGISKVYRIEGNRFAVLGNNPDREELKRAMEIVASVLSKPIMMDGHRTIIEMVCALSHTSGEEEKNQLFSHAMAVLHHSSPRYRHQVVEYDAAVHTYAFERYLIQDIERAMEEEELFLVYQPKVGLESRKILGVEALLRWQHPKYGFVSPAVFIPVLEESGKMNKVTNWIISQVCQQIARWDQEGFKDFQVAINIPGSYFTSPLLMKTLKESVAKYKVNSRCIELEITETSVIHNIESAIRAVVEFEKYGFSVALDDFGTGLSSLSYLRRLPITTLKIDKTFVDEVPASVKDASIVEAIIALGHSLDLNVVIEGVEWEEQVEFLSSLSINPIIQGYYFSKPLKAEELVSWISDFSPVLV
ncbi:EAL domain-containing protein [Heyndrickxia acidicola]|uniref:EAL domain-containing protein n=1 Tax=Heyndrickxia acidicola TaxID=209389 RepID=A0ABU6MSP8_9BACI|nr:EAL domain-containing protein [Heyndrickxia acidicola]MED1206055.1 EAL domain-containing protein [Heyndrickxia acidicola]